MMSSYRYNVIAEMVDYTRPQSMLIVAASPLSKGATVKIRKSWWNLLVVHPLDDNRPRIGDHLVTQIRQRK
jgi:hypothetical protein